MGKNTESNKKCTWIVLAAITPFPLLLKGGGGTWGVQGGGGKVMEWGHGKLLRKGGRVLKAGFVS